MTWHWDFFFMGFAVAVLGVLGWLWGRGGLDPMRDPPRYLDPQPPLRPRLPPDDDGR